MLSSRNPHLILELHTQYAQKMNVWCGIGNSITILGPYFFDVFKCIAHCLDFLVFELNLSLTAMFPNDNDPENLHKGCSRMEHLHPGLQIRNHWISNLEHLHLALQIRIHWISFCGVIGVRGCIKIDPITLISWNQRFALRCRAFLEKRSIQYSRILLDR